MSDFTDESRTSSQSAEFYLATVTSGDSTNGYKLQFAGESSARNKSYKALKIGSGGNYASGSRVIVMKISGTFVVLGML